MFRTQYIKRRLKPVMLSTSIADSGTVMSHIIPWNINGAFYAGTLGVAAMQWVPFTFFAYLTPIVTFIMVRAYFLHKNQLTSDQDVDQIYGAEPTNLPSAQDLA